MTGLNSTTNYWTNSGRMSLTSCYCWTVRMNCWKMTSCWGRTMMMMTSCLTVPNCYLKRMTSLGRSRNLTSLKMTLRPMSCYYYLKRAPTS
jgi:hypothetical protein